MEKLIDLLKIFEEKHLIPAIASIALAIFFVIFLPDLFDLTNKAGKVLYIILVFCIAFLLIQFGKYMYSFIKNKIVKRHKQKEATEVQQKEEEELEEKAMENLWDYVDSLSPQDKHYLKEFLITNNKPIEVMGVTFDGLLSNSSIVACTDKNPESSLYPNRKIELEGHLVYPLPDSLLMHHSPVKLYRLKDKFFKLLKYSHEKYHKISHFDMEETQNGQIENANSQ